MARAGFGLCRIIAAAVFVAGLAFPAAGELDMLRSKPSSDDAALRQMIGQMILVGFVGDTVDAEGFQTVVRQAAEGKITGVIYLRRNIRSKEDVRQMNGALQKTARKTMLISVDQEGGRIERLTKKIGFRETPSAANVASTMSSDDAVKVYERLAHDLADLGFNVNFGPVVDVNVNPRNPIIGRLGRSFSSDPNKVVDYALAFVEAHRKFGVLTSLKHFPGHGSSVGDTHKGGVDVTSTWQRNIELLPYEALMTLTQVDMVMVAHVVNRELSHRAVPASLSSEVLQTLLRKAIGFNGVIISDDMQMDAVAGTRSFEQGVREAVMAGNDILIFANDKNPDPAIPEKIANILVKEAAINKTLRARIRNAAARVAKMKAELKPGRRLSSPPDP